MGRLARCLELSLRRLSRDASITQGYRVRERCDSKAVKMCKTVPDTEVQALF